MNHSIGRVSTRMRELLWTSGFGMGVAIGVALGGSFVKERGRRILPIVVVLTLILGLLIGWGLNGQYDAMLANGG